MPVKHKHDKQDIVLKKIELKSLKKNFNQCNKGVFSDILKADLSRTADNLAILNGIFT